MQAASRESYGVAAERLDAYAQTAEPSAIADTADGILSVADLLRREARLRRALSDPARSGEERAALLGGLLGGKVTADGLRVARRVWSPAAGRPRPNCWSGTERLGVEALLASADRADDLGEVEDELFRFGQVVGADPG